LFLGTTTERHYAEGVIRIFFRIIRKLVATILFALTDRFRVSRVGNGGVICIIRSSLKVLTRDTESLVVGSGGAFPNFCILLQLLYDSLSTSNASLKVSLSPFASFSYFRDWGYCYFPVLLHENTRKFAMLRLPRDTSIEDSIKTFNKNKNGKKKIISLSFS